MYSLDGLLLAKAQNRGVALARTYARATQKNNSRGLAN